MDTIKSQNMETLVDLIFSKPPKPPCTYTLMLPETVVVNQVVMFQLLMSFLIAGAKHLYGNQITPEQISEKQFEELKDYIKSVGYMIRYNYKYEAVQADDKHLSQLENPRIINIWFEKYFETTDCHGRKIYL
jgi:endonuclease III